MKKKAVVCLKTAIINDLGMHARPAAKIAEMAMEAQGEVWISKGSSQVDASSIIDILTLNAVKGTCVEIQAENQGDEPILNRIKRFFEQGFGELNNE
ncbi:HPr family phosphocarrier protein [Desulfospira joergensenii]|uniref:HPr family phosphocarrier protein n=1 Tax=Desulfospira joergensenii TaxID=53329 RepID=UPI0003B2FCF6|nr:HPr family phosphocarrier protein [Desulfospira joergensenii]